MSSKIYTMQLELEEMDDKHQVKHNLIGFQFQPINSLIYNFVNHLCPYQKLIQLIPHLFTLGNPEQPRKKT